MDKHHSQVSRRRPSSPVNEHGICTLAGQAVAGECGRECVCPLVVFMEAFSGGVLCEPDDSPSDKLFRSFKSRATMVYTTCSSATETKLWHDDRCIIYITHVHITHVRLAQVRH